MRPMDESEIQALAESPMAISEARGKNHLRLVLNVVCILILLWLARGWLLRADHWLDSHFQKEIARRLGISTGAIGFVWFLVHSGWQIFHATAKKKQKGAEEEKKQFDPRYNPNEKRDRYNPIEERDSESWGHERHHD